MSRVTRFSVHGLPRIVIEHINITERKQAEEALRLAKLKAEEEARHREFQHSLISAIHEVSPDGILVVNDDGNIVSHNQRFLEVWRLSAAEVAQDEQGSGLPAADERTLSACVRRVKNPDSFLEKVRELYANPVAGDHREIELNDGRTLERHSACLRSERGQHRGRVWFFRDITERRQAQQALQSSEEKFRQLAENIREVFWMMNPGGTEVLYVSPAYESIWGRSCASLYERPAAWQETVHPDDLEQANLLSRRQLEGEPVELEYRIRTPEGQEKWIRNRAFPVRDEDGQLSRVVGIAEEITEQRRYEENLIRAREAADAASRAKSRFLANMSHEIRTPMNGVIRMNQLLLETDLTQEQRHYVEIAQSSGRTLLALIDDILDLSKIETGKIVLENASFNLSHAVEDVVRLLLVQANAKRLHLNARVSSKIPAALRGDVHRLQQVLTNLSANAIKFTDRGTITLEADLESLHDCRVKVRFAITDTGIGIRPDQIPSLFSPFVQADASTTRRYGGTGLGLAISKQLVEKMGGSIGVKSQEGRGSTFWFTAVFEHGVPDACPYGMKGRNESARTADSSRSGHGEKILVAEDNATNREVILAQLKKLGYRARAVTNGAEACEAVENGSCALVLMDCEMPVMDGFEATRRIRRSSQARVPIIALTASAMASDREQCLSAGMDDYLAKPVELMRLAEVLARWMPASGSIEAPTAAETAVSADRVFDANALLRRLLGDRELAGAVLHGFLQDAPRQLQHLRDRIDEQDASGVRLQAHSLKGAAATVAAEALHATALAIESAATAGRLESCRALLECTSQELGRFRSAVEHDGWVTREMATLKQKRTSNDSF